MHQILDVPPIAVDARINVCEEADDAAIDVDGDVALNVGDVLLPSDVVGRSRASAACETAESAHASAEALPEPATSEALKELAAPEALPEADASDVLRGPAAAEPAMGTPVIEVADADAEDDAEEEEDVDAILTELSEELSEEEEAHVGALASEAAADTTRDEVAAAVEGSVVASGCGHEPSQSCMTSAAAADSNESQLASMALTSAPHSTASETACASSLEFSQPALSDAPGVSVKVAAELDDSGWARPRVYAETTSVNEGVGLAPTEERQADTASMHMDDADVAHTEGDEDEVRLGEAGVMRDERGDAIRANEATNMRVDDADEAGAANLHDADEVCTDEFDAFDAYGEGMLDMDDEENEMIGCAALELQPEVAHLYLQQLLSFGLVRVPLSECEGEGGLELVGPIQAEALQVSLESFLLLETELEKDSPADERVQIAHKLLLDALNAALREEVLRFFRVRAPRVGVSGGASPALLPKCVWHALPSDDATLQRLVQRSMQSVLRWLAHASAGEDLPIEVQLSHLLAGDAADIESEWTDLARHKEDLLADISDEVLLSLIEELEGEAGLEATADPADGVAAPSA